MKPTVVDFETQAITGRPAYPPVPVGVSVQTPGMRKPRYFAWGHPTNNNCSKEDAARVLQDIWRSGDTLLFQNAKFDTEVAEKWFGLPIPAWERIQDTLYLIFLADPHAMTYSLKPAAARFLGMPPEEQDAVRDWLVEHQPVPDVKITAKNFGAYIAYVPGDLVGRYADGDIIRTKKLFEKLHPQIRKDGMLEAYDRERQLMPILLRNEQVGMRVDVDALAADLAAYNAAMLKADNWLRKRLASPELNIDSDAELADALDAQGIVTDWVTTATGRRSTAKKNMTTDMFKDKRVAQVLGYRNRLATCIGTFMEPWFAMAQAKGCIYTNWNQVRQSRSEGEKGTRTGRMSTNPNFQNIPKVFTGKDDGYEHPAFLRALPELPLMRKYILPDKNQLFLHRDYNQQELRILAHFEDGDMCKTYNENPRMDVHDFVRDAIAAITGRVLPRSPVKILNFGIIYGMGLGKLAQSMRVDIEEAREIKNAHRKGVPGVAVLERKVKHLGASGNAIRTWGGRIYYTEPPKIIDGEERTFEYKLLNYLIQGSAADCTKQALINYDSIKKDGRFLVTVHDEINISAPKRAAKSEMKLLREAMEGVKFDVPMLSDGKSGESWGALTKYVEK